MHTAEDILGMGSANKSRRCNVTLSVIAWARAHNDLWYSDEIPTSDSIYFPCYI